MIAGIGCDMIEIGRIERSCRSDRFMARVFSPGERAAYAGCASRLAGCFAVKEALSKALGMGVRGFSLAEISVLRDALGKPYVIAEGRAAALVGERRIHASITNTAREALAFVILEEDTL